MINEPIVDCHAIDYLSCREHSHIWYVMQGTIKLITSDSEHICTEGSCIFIPPYMMNELVSVGDIKPTIVRLTFHDRFLTDRGYPFFSYHRDYLRFEKKSIPLYRKFQGKDKEYADSLFLSLANEFSRHRNTSFDKLAELLADALTLLCKHAPICNTYKFKHVLNYSYAITRAVMYIDFNRAEKITTAKLCELTGMSRSVFTERFREITGMACAEFIYTLRRSNAMHLLSHTVTSIDEIARKVGFVTSSRLSHIFAKDFGMTPMQYRKQTQTLGLNIDYNYWKELIWFKERDFPECESSPNAGYELFI
ncbi:MAG: helix-turn-helix transcriptional regulator [Oscillospiraceae bacterium]|nr:helix-turn-helix transcriptional regulator [Oscillospiraceae bacterium]MBQ6697438.1 helix-turn-helix transcriptional regulator [Oscillospiraceae bacterium]